MALIYTQLAQDLFLRPDENPLDPAQWSENLGGDGTLAIVSHLCVAGDSSFGLEIYTGVVFPDNQYAEIVVANWDAVEGALDVGVQVGTNETVTANFNASTNGDGTSTFSLFVNGGSGVTVVAPDPITGDVLRIEIVGTSATAKVNGTVILSASVGILNVDRQGPAVTIVGTSSVSAFRAGSIVDTGSNVLVCDGDSITAGAFVTTPYPSSLNLQGSWEVHNVAVSGENLATMLANAPTVVDTLFRPGVENVVTILAGINDLDQGTLPADLIKLLWEYCAGRRAVGFKVVVFSLTSAHEPLDTLRDEYNDLMIAQWQGHADGFGNMGENPFVGLLGSYADPTYFQPDEVHPTQLATTDILAPIASEQVNNITNVFTTNVTVSDIFQRPDETPLAAPWTAPTGGVGLNLSGKLAVGTNPTADSADFYSTFDAPDDQYAEAVVGNTPAASEYIGPAVRMQSGSDSFYGLFVQPNQNGATIFRWDAGTGTSISDTFPVDATFGGRFRLVAQGSLLSAYQNGVFLGSVTDATYTSGKAGIVGFGPDAASSEWSAGVFNFTISGSVGVANATVVLSGDASATTTADSSGGYFFAGLQPGNYVVTPNLGGDVFTPTSQPVTITTANVTEVDFTTGGSAYYSVPDCRNYATFPNLSRDVQGTLTYDVPAHPSYAPPVDSRTYGAPLDCRIPPNIPQNSRAPGTYGPDE